MICRAGGRGGSGRGGDHAVALRGPRIGVKMPDAMLARRPNRLWQA
jgi:hypothetical protein